jgi:hypothetical protein
MARIEVRMLEEEDLIPMYLLRASDDVSSVSLRPPPTMAQHKEYVYRVLQGKSPPVYVATVDGLYAGSCTVTSDLFVNVMVASPYRRMGIADMLIRYVQQRHTQLVALIHKDNTASLALFLKCGFLLTPDFSPYRVLVYRRDDASTCSHCVDGTME